MLSGAGIGAFLDARRGTTHRYITNLDHGYAVLGYIVIASAVMSAFIRIKGESHLFGTLEE